MEDEYYSDEEGVHKPPPEFNIDALADFLDRVTPLFDLHIAANEEQRAFDNYEVIWEEEFGEVGELHVMKTDYDFVQANQAVQKTLNLEKDNTTQASSHVGGASGFDDWDDKPSQSSNARASRSGADDMSVANSQAGAISPDGAY